MVWAACATPAGAVCLFPPPPPPQQQQPPPPPQQPPPPEPPTEEAPQKRVEAQVVPTGPPKEPRPEAAEWFIEWKYAVNATDLKGNAERSFLNEGVNHILDFSYLNKQPLAGGRLLETVGVFRYTDDPRVDPERNSLQRGYVRLTGPTFELVGGDTLVNYSRFSFNQNMKGLNFRKDTTALGGWRLTGSAGVFTDRWGSLLRGWEKFTDPRNVPDPRIPAKPYTRLVLGYRLEKPIKENQWLAVNYSDGRDVVRSLPREAQIAPFSNQVATFDWLLLFRRNLRVNGELALSATEFDARFQPGKVVDYAARVEVSQQWRRYRWRVEYSRFMPNFFSVNARQVQDLQDVSGQLTVELTKSLSVTGSWRRTNDNLPGRPALAFLPKDRCNPAERPLCLRALSQPSRTLPVTNASSQLIGMRLFDHLVDAEGNQMTTVVRAPEIKLAVRSLPFWPRLLLEVGYRERVLETSNTTSYRLTSQTSATTGQSIVTAAPLFRDRATKIPFFDMTFPVGIQTFRFGYEYRRNRDHVQPELSTFTHRVTAQHRLPSLFIGAWTLSTDVKFETERESKQIDLATLAAASSGLPFLDPHLRPLILRQSDGDQIRTIQGSMTLEFPKYFVLDLLYRELNAALLSSVAAQDLLAGGFLFDNRKEFGNGGYRRPKWRGQLTYKIRNDENKYFVFTVERNVNTFFVVDKTQADTRSFREKLAQITFVYRFKR